VTTAIRDGESGTATARPGPGLPGRRGGRDRPRLSVTWPVTALFTAFPIWWLLGLSAVIWSIMVAPLLVALVWRRRAEAPAVILLWFTFVIWVLMSGLQLTSGTKIITFSYRLTLYVCGGLLFLYVYNLPRRRRLDSRVLNTLTTFWMIVVIGGYIGILGGSHSFPSVIEFVLPRHLRSQPFVAELVHPVLANVETFLGFPVPRPSAPFPYTNNWGGIIAVLTPVALASMSATTSKTRRRMIVVFLVASLIPMIVSLNRGMFLSLGAGLLYVAIRLAGRGRIATLASLLVLMIGLTALVALTPLKHLVLANASSTHGHSDTTRMSVAQQAIAGANQSPLLGFGAPQAVTGQGGTPPIGTQGQLWMVLYSQGYVATTVFIGFFLVVLWQTRRAAGTAGLWLQSVPLVALTQITVYGWLPVELQIVMVTAALAYRRCWYPSGAGKKNRPLRRTDSVSLLAHGPEPQEPWPSHAIDDPVTIPERPKLKVPDLTSLKGAPQITAAPSPRPQQPSVPSAYANGSGHDSANGVSRESGVVARNSIVNLVAMVTGAAMSFGLVVLASRWLQPDGAGQFYELIAMFTILSNTFELGADTGLLRWISRARATGGLRDVGRVTLIALIPVTAVGAAVAVALWLVAPEASRLFLHGVPVAAGTADIRFVAPLVPLGALSSVIVDGVRGYGRMWPYLVIEGLGKPTVRIVAVAAVLLAGLSLHVAIIVWGLPVIAGLIAACLIFVGVMRKETPREVPDTRPAAAQSTGQNADERSRTRTLAVQFWAFTGPRALQATFQVTVLFLDVLIVGALASTYQAGIYSAVSKLAILGTFALEGNRLAIGPQLSALMSLGQRGRAAELYQTATRSLVLLTFPLYLVLAMFPSVILGIFGSKYSAGASALAVLCLAMLINLGTGNIVVVLLMGGKSSWCAINAGVAFAVNIALNLLLVPHLGVLGAAIAWSASIVIDNVAAMIEVRWLMAMPLFGDGFLLASGITLACFGVTGLAARLLLGETIPALLAAAAAGTVSYAFALYFSRSSLQIAELARAMRPGNGARTGNGKVKGHTAIPVGSARK
jgi:O-antigen/teichoic acid export membrane protein